MWMQLVLRVRILVQTQIASKHKRTDRSAVRCLWIRLSSKDHLPFLKWPLNSCISSSTYQRVRKGGSSLALPTSMQMSRDQYSISKFFGDLIHSVTSFVHVKLIANFDKSIYIKCVHLSMIELLLATFLFFKLLYKCLQLSYHRFIINWFNNFNCMYCTSGNLFILYFWSKFTIQYIF